MEKGIDHIDPVHLRALPTVKNLPRWAPQSPEFNGFCRDIAANGIRQPLLVTDRNFVVDGETRRMAAIHLRMDEVPCIVVSNDEIHSTMLRGIVGRRNLTKGQRAFLVEPFLADAFNESLRRRSMNASKTKPTESDSFFGKKSDPSDSVGGVPSAAERAAEMGFSRDLLDQAHRLHAIFSKKPELREFWEPRILDMDDPVGLGAALAGIAGAGADQSERLVGILKHAFSGARKQSAVWQKLSAGEREQVKKSWIEDTSELPGSMRNAMKEVL